MPCARWRFAFCVLAMLVVGSAARAQSAVGEAAQPETASASETASESESETASESESASAPETASASESASESGSESETASESGSESGSGSASEAGSETAPYEAVIDEALGHYQRRQWELAHEAFARAHALLPNARTERGMALSAYYAGDYLAAAEGFERALADARRPLTEVQRVQARELMTTARRHLGRVAIVVEPADADVQLEGRALPPSHRDNVLLLPGNYRVRVTAPGHAESIQRVDVGAGDKLIVRIDLELIERHQPVPPVAVPAPVEHTTVVYEAPEAGAPWPWIAAGATVVSALGAGTFALLGNEEFRDLESRCRIEGCDEARRRMLWDDSDVETYETLTNVALVVTAAGAVTTATLFLLDLDAPGERAGGRVQLRLAPGAVGLSGRF